MTLPTDLPTTKADHSGGHTNGHNTTNARVNAIAAAVNTHTAGDVTLYGADPTGVADSTAAFAAAIAAQAVVDVPPGTYVVSVDAKTGKRIRGAGWGQVTLKAKTGAATVILGSSADTVTNFTLDGVTVDGGWSTTAATVTGVQITNGANIVVRDCRFTNLGAAAVLLQGLGASGGTPHSRVVDNIIDGAGLSDGTTGFGVLIKDASVSCTVARNDIRNVKGGMGVGTNGSGGTGYPTHLTISDNTIQMLDGTTDFEAIGLVAGSDYALIADNNITDSWDNGISYSAARGTITGNIIDGARNHGIAIAGAGTTVTGNMIRNIGKQNDAAYAGISVTTGGRCVVLGNTIVDDQGVSTTSYGVKLTTSAGTNLIALNTMSGQSVSPFNGVVTGDLVLDTTTQTNGFQMGRVYTDDVRVATSGQSGTINNDWRALSRFWVGNTATGSGQLNVFSNAGSTRPNACFNAVASQAADLWQAVASDISTVLARCTITGRLQGADGITTRDLGDITGLTSAQIDALFTAAPPDGTLATGLRSATPVALCRRNGKWNFVNQTLIT